MNILLIGAGGREHSFARKLKQSPLCEELFIAPGNTGTALCGTNLNISVSDFPALAAAAIAHRINIILVGPEEPLVKGITDFFRNAEYTKHIKVIGPGKEAAQLEGSKAFAKDFMTRHGVPTAAYREFTAGDFREGLEYLSNCSLPIVLKADGLAAGKGVLICSTHLEAQAEFELMIMRAKFGEAGKKVVVEDFLKGIEMSVFVLTDGKDYVLLPEAKDYKRIGEGDTGLNTGGMGAVSPVPLMNEALKEKIIKKIIDPTIRGLQEDGLDYTGFIFIGLMLDGDEPFVVEYNCRMGDPETEVVIPRLKNDLVALLDAAAGGYIAKITVETDERAAVGIVAVSGGYPGGFQKGEPISGIDGYDMPGSILFHAGTRQEGKEILTNGGRVLVAVSLGANITEAAEEAEYLLQQVSFNGMKYRKDIGYEFR